MTTPVVIAYKLPSGKTVNRVFTGKVITIGRGRENTICLSSEFSVMPSRQHAELEWIDDETLVIRDRGSVNGTTVNGDSVTSDFPLRPGDKIVLGKDVILFVFFANTGASTWKRTPHNFFFAVALDKRIHSEFNLFEHVADGAHGTIWRATGPGVGGWRAIKVLFSSDEISGNPVEVEAKIRRRNERFSREGDILNSYAREKGVYVVRAHSMGVTDEGLSFLVMDYVNGPSLKDHVMEHHPVPMEDLLGWFYDVAFSLRKAHEFSWIDSDSEQRISGIIHRDVRPSNILIEIESGHALLCDFGVAAFMTGGDRITRPQDMVSHLLHTPPECYYKRQITPEMDLWSLAMSFYMAASGMSLPYEGRKAAELQENIRRGKLHPLSERRPDVPPLVDKLVTDSLAFDPASRPTLKEWVEMLLPWAKEPSGTQRVRARR